MGKLQLRIIKAGKAGCTHHWYISSVNSGIGIGTCIKCGATREFVNFYNPDIKTVMRAERNIYVEQKRAYMVKDLNLKRLEVLRWAARHDFVIDPFKGMDFHIESFFKVGFCPCDKTRRRLKCPCDESLVDVLKTGHCLCQLFWAKKAVVARVKKYIKEKADEQKLCKERR